MYTQYNCMVDYLSFIMYRLLCHLYDILYNKAYLMLNLNSIIYQIISIIHMPCKGYHGNTAGYHYLNMHHLEQPIEHSYVTFAHFDDYASDLHKCTPLILKPFKHVNAKHNPFD